MFSSTDQYEVDKSKAIFSWIDYSFFIELIADFSSLVRFLAKLYIMNWSSSWHNSLNFHQYFHSQSL